MDYRSTSEVATETVESVQFGFMTDEEVKKLSFQKITKPDLLDSTIGQPVPGGLYDTALGSLDDITPCKSCGQRSFHCPGHSGHIELVSPVYNPLQFSMLFTVLQKTCFFCYHFKATAEQVGACLSKLKLIMKGDIIGARRLHLSPSGLDALDASLGELSEDSDSNLHSKMEDGCSEHVDQHEWTSFQLVEAMSILKDFLKKKTKTCGKCRAKNPTIYRPTFGWIHMKGMPDADMKANVIRGLTVNGPVANEDDDRSASEVENIDINGHGASNKKKRKKEKAASEFLKQKQSFSRSLLPSEVREILQRLWENEAQLCSFICNIQKGQSFTFWKNAGFTMFFLKTVLVAPIKFRPPARAGNSVMDHPQTVLLRKVLEANISLGNAYEQHAEPAYIIKQWMYLQLSVNILFDSKTAPGQAQKEEYGICQLLEKKDGIFRQKMMGKRVNFACRSVISPDPYLAVNEIGIPPVFALKLTYPERVTAWNVTRLRDAIVNGPEVHPGATHYVDKLSTTKLPSSRNMRIAISRKLPSSRGAVMHPGKNCDYEFEGKAVYRHLRDGDIVLVNRQPTLHKPSIIALKVRVLPGEKTLRFHYANCDSFNADFDGDEINVHLPQDEISRAEAYSIANADNQYIVPTRGDPKRALIQDHIVSAVILTKRDTFLTWEQFSELLYSSGLSNYKAHSFNAKSDRRVSAVDYEELIEYVPPAVIKPRPLWTGKQVITAILKHITRDHMPFTVKKRAKIAREYFGKGDSNKKTAETSRKGVENSEDKKKGDRVSKKKNTDDLGSRMVKDLGKNKKDSERKVGVTNYTMDEDVVFVYKNELLQGVIDKEQFGKYGLVHTVQELYGSSAAGNLLSVLSRLLTSFLQMYGFTCGVDDLLLVKDYDVQRKKLLDVCLNSGEEVHQQFIGREKEHLDPAEMQIELEKAVRRNGESAVALLDGMMRSKLNSLNSSLSKLFPEGLVKPFRKNCLSLMTLSGAKGGTFNFQQISLLLGQQELEGKRVPRMVSGKTLPCFPAWDTAARSGGYISDRYLTGLRPQEFYFHCMAGREGLVDTAVKTSRSGYLQRCLIKNLECLKVHYDYTVRDADGSIVQFRYGEDGVDVHQKNFMEEYEALAMNQEIIQSKTSFSIAEDACISKYIEEDDELPDQLRKKTEKFVEDASTAKNYGLRRQKDRANFVKLVKHKYLMSLAQPGEPVGVIAAQSVGEPSTQMTLNTFHHAGRGEMNVTLGIPRLQEILMTASIAIRTPTMTCPLHKSKSKDNAERLAAKLKRITVADLIEKMEVHVVPFAVDDHGISSIYKLKIKLYEPELYPPHTDISLEDCERVLGGIFLFELENAIKNHVLLLSKISGIKNFLSVSNQKASDETNEDDDTGKSTPVNDDDDDNDEGANEEGADDLGMDAQKEKRQATDEIDYEEDSLEDGKDLVDDGQDVEPVSEYGSEVEQADDEEEEENTKHDEHESDATERLEDGPASKEKSKVKTDKSKAKKQKKGKQIATKESDRVIYFIAEGSYFEVHCRFTDEPHILLTEIAQKTAKKVYIKNSGKIEQCKVVELNLDESNEGIPMLRKGKESRPALQTAGVDFKAFWNMQDELDINYISSNDIHAMLNTYGVEAARATIITEIFRVFNHYGVSVDMRHLTLIADYMTHTGGYQPMSRSGAIAGSVSPFAKMSFETASKFIVEAACYGEVDTLETPSARICLGLPAKVGTGCFDVMHQLEI